MFEIRDILDVTDDEYEEFLGPWMAENIDRDYFRAIAAHNPDDDSIAGGLVWRYINLENDDDTASSLELLKADNADCVEELLSNYDEKAAENNVVKTSFEFDNLDKSFSKVFKDKGYKIEKREGKKLRVSLEDISKVKSLIKEPGKYNIIALRDIDMMQFRRAITNCVFCGETGLEEDLAMLPKKWFEEDLSGCIFENDAVAGLFLVRLTGNNELVPELLFAGGDEADKQRLEMLRFTVNEAIKKYDMDTKIVITRRGDNIKKITDYLFPDKKGDEIIAGERGGN
ncbi:hypothetical protein [Butyrivibrio sp. AE3004]|uniref:hypothetical protein n=1 Tax=Butyrivibrio sp. AE3004 TaxID=1506994 RepID=UPI000493C660|nr:hypothetical protein [Butyrivibrio sp. AE3004]